MAIIHCGLVPLQNKSINQWLISLRNDHMNTMKLIYKPIALVLFILISASGMQGQSFKSLNRLNGLNIDTYFSEGSKEQAVHMATLCDSVISFYKSHIEFQPNVTLLVLSPADWSQYTSFPVYGMPHYPDAQTLVVASHDNDFWKSMLPPLDKLPKELAKQISSTYSDVNNNLTMRGFFDLLAIHELGHAFHEQGKLTMQRKWMGELFANMYLHTYIAEMKPELLPELTTFPKMVLSSSNKEELRYTTLAELEANYDLITQKYPQNYGWYQCKWHIASGNIYDEGGIAVFQKLWEVLKTHTEPLDDSSFATLLSNEVHNSVADVQLNWND